MANAIRKKASNFFVWIILGLLLVALAGFGVTSFTGGSSLVGRVGSSEITAEDYFRALEQEIRVRSAETGQPVRLVDLQATGTDMAVRQGLIARAALLSEAREMGISVGDEVIAEQIRSIPNFQGPNGFSREAYEFEIGRIGLSTAAFEEDIREDTTRSLLQIAVVGGITAPEFLADAVTARETERRNFTIARLTETDLAAPLAEPSEADLQAHYDEFGDAFTRPEIRRISYAWVTPEMILDEVEVDQDLLRAIYEDRLDEYVRPERRLVERLVFPDADAAEAARDAIDAGDAAFDDLVEDRGLSLDDIDMGDVARTDLTDAAAEAVFADEDAEIVGPVDSAFGPAIFRINAVLSATEVTFEEAEPDLRAEFAVDAARRAIATEREVIEDAMASGATLEELEAETMMQFGQIDFSVDNDAGIAAYDEFRTAAASIEEGDFPETLELSDGGLFAIRLDETVPPTIPPLAEIEDEVAEAWRVAALSEALEARAGELMAQAVTLGAALEDQGLDLQSETSIGRQEFVPDAPPTLVALVFDLDTPGDMAVVPGTGEAMIVRLDGIEAGNINAPDVAFLRDLVQQQASQSFASDMFDGFGRAMEADVGLTLNQAVINAVHANFP